MVQGRERESRGSRGGEERKGEAGHERNQRRQQSTCRCLTGDEQVLCFVRGCDGIPSTWRENFKIGSSLSPKVYPEWRVVVGDADPSVKRRFVVCFQVCFLELPVCDDPKYRSPLVSDASLGPLLPCTHQASPSSFLSDFLFSLFSLAPDSTPQLLLFLF